MIAENKCYTKMSLAQAGALLTFSNPMFLSPAEAPYPLLNESDVAEPPLPEVTSQPPTSKPVKAEAKDIEVPFAFITMAILVCFFTLV